jgi:hypothetical protein
MTEARLALCGLGRLTSYRRNGFHYAFEVVRVVGQGFIRQISINGRPAVDVGNPDELKPKLDLTR